MSWRHVFARVGVQIPQVAVGGLAVVPTEEQEGSLGYHRQRVEGPLRGLFTLAPRPDPPHRLPVDHRDVLVVHSLTVQPALVPPAAIDHHPRPRVDETVAGPTGGARPRQLHLYPPRARILLLLVLLRRRRLALGLALAEETLEGPEVAEVLRVGGLPAEHEDALVKHRELVAGPWRWKRAADSDGSAGTCHHVHHENIVEPAQPVVSSADQDPRLVQRDAVGLLPRVGRRSLSSQQLPLPQVRVKLPDFRVHARPGPPTKVIHAGADHRAAVECPRCGSSRRLRAAP